MVKSTSIVFMIIELWCTGKRKKSIPVVHHKHLEFLGGVHQKFVKAIGQHVSSFLVRSYDVVLMYLMSIVSNLLLCER